MGQRVSADVDLVDLQDLLGRGQASSPPSRDAAHPLEAGPRQHLKAWKFEPSGRSFVISPVRLCDGQGQLSSAQLQRTASYLILHLRGDGPPPAEPLPGQAAAALEELASHAEASCSPRGLSIEVSSRADDRCAGPGAQLRFAVFVWHGLRVEPLMKAHVFAKAFELDRVLRAGLLWQRGFLDTLSSAVPLTAGAPRTKQQPGGDAAARGGGTPPAAEALHLSCNRLVTSILEGAGARGGCSSSRGTQRFPRLGLSLRRSLGATGGAREQRWARAAAPPLESAPLTGGLSPESTASSEAGGPLRAGAAGKPAGVPRLNLGGLGARPGAGAGRSGGPMELDEAAGDSSGRKRKGCELAAGGAAAPAARSAREPSPASTPGQQPLPKSARDPASPQFPPLLPLTLGKVGAADEPPAAASARPAAAAAAAPPRLGLTPALDLPAAGGAASPPARLGAGGLGCGVGQMAPAMLNLEDINTSQDRFADSFDPENEENNYHMPHHVFKQLQLKHYRQECSEVVPGELYISSYQVASNLESLQRWRITHIVNTAADVCDSCFPDLITYTTYYLKDTNSEEISLLFYRTLEWIQNAINRGGRVLVHCREGVSRSATMVIAYLMWRFRLSFEAAHERLRKARPICNPNTGFTCQLLLLGKKLGIGPSGTPCGASEPALLFRVGPHHPREPFLVLVPVEWQAPPLLSLDPRFGWVVQRGLQLVLWLGSQTPDAAAARAAVAQHAARLQTFEGSQCAVSTVHEGQETAIWWQALGMPAAGPPEPMAAPAPRPALDADFEVLTAVAAGGSEAGVPARPSAALKVPLAAFESPRDRAGAGGAG